MSELMSDDAKQFVVVHDIHKRREYPDAAVGTGERIDVDDLVDLEIQGYAVGLVETLHEFVEADGIGVVICGDGVVLVHPVDRLAHILCHLLVCDCQGLHGL